MMGAIYGYRQGRNRVKIGWTGDTPYERKKAHQTGSTYPLEFLGAWRATKAEEGRLHYILSEYSVPDAEGTECYFLVPQIQDLFDKFGNEVEEGIPMSKRALQPYGEQKREILKFLMEIFEPDGEALRAKEIYEMAHERGLSDDRRLREVRNILNIQSVMAGNTCLWRPPSEWPALPAFMDLDESSESIDCRVLPDKEV